MSRRSIGFPLTLGIVLAILVLALGVAWQLQILVWDDVRAVREGLSYLDWVLLVAGAIFFALVFVGVFWLCLWLVREIAVNQRLGLPVELGTTGKILFLGSHCQKFIDVPVGVVRKITAPAGSVGRVEYADRVE